MEPLPLRVVNRLGEAHHSQKSARALIVGEDHPTGVMTHDRKRATSLVGLPIGHIQLEVRGLGGSLNIIHEGQSLGKGEDREGWKVRISGWAKRK